MRALLVLRSDAHVQPGGDVVHAARTRDALRVAGVDADIVATELPEPAGYDVAHVFGIFEPETAGRQMAAVREAGVPLVLSPIWLDLTPFLTIAPYLERALRAPRAATTERRLAQLRRDEDLLLRRGRAAAAAHRRLERQRELVREAKVLIAGSETEAYLYGTVLRIGRIPVVVAPLGVDLEAFAAAAPLERSGVLCAGRVEPKKNQAALLYALHDVNVEVTVVGRAYDEHYLSTCRRWATPRTRFVDHLPQSELLRLMARARVHAHPSWLETPGLSSVQAAAAGARLVVGDRGAEREYFGAEVDYADPADPAAIREAVVRALARGPRPAEDRLVGRLRERTWQRTGELTLRAYERALVGDA